MKSQRNIARLLLRLTLTLVGLMSWNTLPIHFPERAVQAATRARVTEPTGQPVSRAAANGRIAFAENATLERRERNRAFILMQYFGYLRRHPDAAPDVNFAGYHFWLDKLDRFGGDFVQAEMVKAFIMSGEYQQRFGH